MAYQSPIDILNASALRTPEDIGGMASDASLRKAQFANSPTALRSFMSTLAADDLGAARDMYNDALISKDAGDMDTARMEVANRLRMAGATPTTGATTFDEAHKNGDYLNYLQNVVGNAGGSMVKPMIGGGVGNLVLGVPGAVLGSFGGSYNVTRNAEMNNMYEDPHLAQLSPEQKNDLARSSSVKQAALDSILPTYLAAGGKLPAFLGRVPNALRLAGGIAGEAGTEAAQDYISQREYQKQFPERDIDWNSVRENAIAGAIGGGMFEGLSHSKENASQPAVAQGGVGTQTPTGPINPNTPLLPGPDQGDGGIRGRVEDVYGTVADALQEKFGGLNDIRKTAMDKAGDVYDSIYGALRDKFGDADGSLSTVADALREKYGETENLRDRGREILNDAAAMVQDRMGGVSDRVFDGFGEVADAAKDKLSDVVSKIAKSVTGRNSSPEEDDSVSEAIRDADPQDDSSLMGSTMEETMANIQNAEKGRAGRVQRFADYLMNHDETPDSVRERIASFGGDLSSPEAMSYVARQYATQRGGEAVGHALGALRDLGERLRSRGKESGTQNNMQSTSPSERAAFEKLLFDELTPAAKVNPEVRGSLSNIASTFLAYAAKTGDLTASDLPTLSKLNASLQMFRDPDAVAAKLTEYAGVPRDSTSFLSRIKGIASAQQDIKQPNSFLYSSLTPRAQEEMTTADLRKLAKSIDEYTINDSQRNAKSNETLRQMSTLFGGTKEALSVLDFYAAQNRADVRYDANETLMNADEGTGDWNSGMSETDAPKSSFRFADAKTMRPFRAGSEHTGRQSTRAAVGLRMSGEVAEGGTAEAVPYSKYVEESGKDPEAEVRRIFDDIAKRGKEHLRKIQGGEDRKIQYNDLQGEAALLKHVYKTDGAKAALDLYEVLKVSEDANPNVASDEDMNKFSKLIGAEGSERTRVAFVRHDGSRVLLSAESMWKSQGDKEKSEGTSGGESEVARRRRLFAEAVASVLARDDIKGLGTDLSGVVIDRKSGDTAFSADAVEGAMKVSAALRRSEGEIDRFKARVADTLHEYETALKEGDVRRMQDIAEGVSMRLSRQYELHAKLKADSSTAGAVAKAFAREKMNLYKKLRKDMADAEAARFMDGASGKKLERMVALASDRRAPTKRRLFSAIQRSATLDAASEQINEFRAKLKDALNRFEDTVEEGDVDSAEDMVKKTEKSVDALQKKIDELKARPKEDLTPADEAARTYAYEKMRLLKELLSDMRSAEFESMVAEADANRSGIPGMDDEASLDTALRTRREFDTSTKPRNFEEDTGAALRGKERSAGAPAFAKAEGAKKEKMPTASEKKAPAKEDIASPEHKLFKRMYDVAMNEKYDVLDTAEKVVSFAKTALDMRAALSELDEMTMTDEQYELYDTLGMLLSSHESKYASFDYTSLFDGLNPTPEQEAALKEAFTIPRDKIPSLSNNVKLGETKKNAMGTSPSTNPRFVMWFGESKMVNRAGRPVVFYHSSNAMFDEFDTTRSGDNSGHASSGLGIFLSPDKERSAVYGQHTMPLYVRMENPYVMPLKEFSGFKDVAQARERAEALRDAGYDGIYVKEDGTTIVFSPYQVKSIYNSGTFGYADANVRRSAMEGEEGKTLSKEERQKIRDEIIRIRGDKVRVAFSKFATMGASGTYTYAKLDDGEVRRLIRIATDAMNPMGVAWHESMHDFFKMLGGSPELRGIKSHLKAAASTPQAMKKLRELLKEHPEALEAVESDPEERLAYMYQFWAEGKLTLGPTGHSLFQRITRFFRELLGVLNDDEKTRELFTALHAGRFSDPGVVEAVLVDLNAKTLSDKYREVAGPIAKISDSLFTATTDRLKETNIDALSDLADLFHRAPGDEKGGLPFLQKRAQEVGRRLNRLQRILSNTTNEERRRAIDRMQSMEAPSTQLEADIHEYLADMYKYIDEKGVKVLRDVEYKDDNGKTRKRKEWGPVGLVQGYFPRTWDKNTIRNNQQEFIALLTEEIGLNQATMTFKAITGGDGSLELVEGEHSLGFTPWAPNVLDRKFNFITPLNAEKFAKFQSKDLADVLTTYTQRAVHRAEYAAAFGNDGEKITELMKKASEEGATQEELSMAMKAVMAMEGTLGYDFNPRTKELMSGLITYENVLLLPFALFTNLTDPIGVGLRSNNMKEAWKAFTYGMKGFYDAIRREGPDEATETAKMLGLIDDQNMLDAMGHIYNSMHMSKTMRSINSKFFRLNGMEMWNQRMRVAAMLAGQRFILKNIDHKRYMEELGITKDDVFKNPDGTMALTREQLEKAGCKTSLSEATERRIQEALFKWVDGAVLRPNAAHRPIWGSDPRFQLIFHMKQFTYSFQNTVLRRVGEELKHDNVMPVIALVSYVPFMFVSKAVQGALLGRVGGWEDLWTIAKNSVGQSGVFGTGQFVDDAWGDIGRGKMPGTSFMGPTFDHILTILNSVAGPGDMAEAVKRTLPGAKYL